MSLFSKINDSLLVQEDVPADQVTAILKEIEKETGPAPDLFLRSQAQCLAQLKGLKPWRRRALNALARVGKGALIKRYQKEVMEEVDPSSGENLSKPKALWLGVDQANIPQVLREEFDVHEVTEGYHISGKDLSFLDRCQGPLMKGGYYSLKLLHKIAAYSYMISEHQPKAIITTSEYSFTSSAMTQYCEEEGVEHINVMHGDKLYGLRDSFFAFHRCYVWDDHYAYLFKEMKAAGDQFRIARPKSLIMDLDPPEPQRLTYYLQQQTGDELKRLGQALRKLKAQGYAVVVRPHPIYSKAKEVKEAMEGLSVEDPKLPIAKSLGKAQLVASQYSTVLYQAALNGRQAILDDISRPGLYERLKALKYIMTEKPHSRLSDLVKAGGNPPSGT